MCKDHHSGLWMNVISDYADDRGNESNVQVKSIPILYFKLEMSL